MAETLLDLASVQSQSNLPQQERGRKYGLAVRTVAGHAVFGPSR